MWLIAVTVVVAVTSCLALRSVIDRNDSDQTPGLVLTMRSGPKVAAPAFDSGSICQVQISDPVRVLPQGPLDSVPVANAHIMLDGFAIGMTRDEVEALLYSSTEEPVSRLTDRHGKFLGYYAEGKLYDRGYRVEEFSSCSRSYPMDVSHRSASQSIILCVRRCSESRFRD